MCHCHAKKVRAFFDPLSVVRFTYLESLCYSTANKTILRRVNWSPEAAVFAIYFLIKLSYKVKFTYKNMHSLTI